MNYKQLAEGERYLIQSYLKAGYTQKQAAQALNRSPSTICRELIRHRRLKGYRPKQAHQLTTHRRLNAPKAIKVTEQVGRLGGKTPNEVLWGQQSVDLLAA